MNAEMTRASDRMATPMTYCVLSARPQAFVEAVVAGRCCIEGGLPLGLGGAEAVATIMPTVTSMTESCKADRVMAVTTSVSTPG
jgi:hypothetical protein